MFKPSILVAALTLSAAPLASYAYTTLGSFSCAVNGCDPVANVVVRNNILYGPTIFGSLYNYALPGGPIVQQHLLVYPEGGKPVADYEWYSGWFYGVAEGGGTGQGTIFRIKPNGMFQPLYQFTGATDGSQPYGQLLYSPLGGRPAMYGTTMSGGLGFGTVFIFDPLNFQIPLSYQFQGGLDGANPTTGLIFYNGMYYGTTSQGGSNSNGGTLFKIDPTLGTKTILHDFGGAGDGATPSSKLLLANNVMYGATLAGGSSGGGTVYRFDPSTNSLSVRCSFGLNAGDGVGPSGDLARIGAKIYGTTQSGGATNEGTVFKCFANPGVHVSLHDIDSALGEGKLPLSGAMLHAGLLYGTTYGGSGSAGTIFSQTP